MKGVQCYDLFGGIALKIHTFSFFSFFMKFMHRKSFKYVRRKTLIDVLLHKFYVDFL